MKKLFAFAALLALVVPVSHAADDDAAKAAKKIEGTYEVVSATRGGKPDKKAEDVESFTIKDGKITIATKGKEMNAKMTLDPSKKPAHIDIKPEAGEGGKGDTIKGIYVTKDTDKGLELSIAFAQDGGERPKDFKGDGEQEVSIKLLRKKAK